MLREARLAQEGAVATARVRAAMRGCSCHRGRLPRRLGQLCAELLLLSQVAPRAILQLLRRSALLRRLRLGAHWPRLATAARLQARRLQCKRRLSLLPQVAQGAGAHAMAVAQLEELAEQHGSPGAALVVLVLAIVQRVDASVRLGGLVLGRLVLAAAKVDGSVGRARGWVGVKALEDVRGSLDVKAAVNALPECHLHLLRARVTVKIRESGQC